MKVKKYFLTLMATILSVGAFAYPAVPDEDPTAQLLQQYTAQMQELQKSLEKEILPPLKQIAQLGMQVQQSAQTELTPQQEQLFNTYITQLDANLTKLVAPALKDLDVGQFNEQYAQMAQTYGLPAHQFTLPEITENMKGMYLVSALGIFEQTQKLTADELTVLVEIFFPQEEEGK